MGFESFNPKKVDKENLRVGGKVEHFMQASEGAGDEPTYIEKIIEPSDRATKDELMGALKILMDKSGYPPNAIQELEGDQEQINTLNTLTAGFYEAMKKLDFKKQAEIVNSLKRLLG